MKPSSTSDKRSKKGRPKPSKSGVTKGKGAAQKAVSGGKRAMSVAATTDGDNLLDRARMQWQFGDWENLVALERETLEGHPQRAMLALMVGAAHQQVDDHANARRFVSAASEWGCNRRTMARVLHAGADNTLGRIAADRKT